MNIERRRCDHCGRPGKPYTCRGRRFTGLSAYQGERLCPPCLDIAVDADTPDPCYIPVMVGRSRRSYNLGEGNRPMEGEIMTLRRMTMGELIAKWQAEYGPPALPDGWRFVTEAYPLDSAIVCPCGHVIEQDGHCPPCDDCDQCGPSPLDVDHG